MSETIHGLKPGDKVYALPMFLHIGGPIGVNEFRITIATQRRVTGISTPRSKISGSVKQTFYACKYGVEWFLTPESALIQVIALMQKEIEASQRRITQAESFLAVLKLETATPEKELVS